MIKPNEDLTIAVVISANGHEKELRGCGKVTSVAGMRRLRVTFGDDPDDACLLIDENAWDQLEPSDDCDFLLCL